MSLIFVEKGSKGYFTIFVLFVCLQDAGTRREYVIHGLALDSVKGEGPSWGRTALSAVISAMVIVDLGVIYSKVWYHVEWLSVVFELAEPKPLYLTKKRISCLDLMLITEPLDVVTTPTSPPANVKIKMVPRGKVVGFRCGTKTHRSPPKVRSAQTKTGSACSAVQFGTSSASPNHFLHLLPSSVHVSSSWYKDGEQILTSIPGYIVMKDRDLRIVANEFNEGVYTCRIHRRGDIVSANSWAIRLKPEQPSNSWEHLEWWTQGQETPREWGALFWDIITPKNSPSVFSVG